MGHEDPRRFLEEVVLALRGIEVVLWRRPPPLPPPPPVADCALRSRSTMSFVSSVEMNDPWTRTSSAMPDAEVERVALARAVARRRSKSRIVRESVRVGTWNAIRDRKFALITPVITSTEGRCVATMR